eukprot:COSAG01_NODE_55988_length_321_cov_1.153153_1_plen_62_part_01
MSMESGRPGVNLETSLPTHARTGRPLISDLRAIGVPKDDVESREDITASVHRRKVVLSWKAP